MEEDVLKATNQAETILNAGKGLAAAQQLDILNTGREKHAVLVPDGCGIQELDAGVSRPNRKKGERVLFDPESFCRYVNKHKNEDETIILADEDAGLLQAILNDNGAEQPAWGDFTGLLRLGFSEQWKIWTEKNGESFDQASFADFIEDNRRDFQVGEFRNASGEPVQNVSTPELMKMIEDMQIFSEDNTVSKVDRRSGAVTVHYENKNLEKSELKLPEALYLAIPIYRGGDLWQVKARLRFRKQGPAITLHYLLDQVPELKRKAFREICDLVEKGKGEDADGKGFGGVGMKCLQGEIKI